MLTICNYSGIHITSQLFQSRLHRDWIPACAGMTNDTKRPGAIPANAGQIVKHQRYQKSNV